MNKMKRSQTLSLKLNQQLLLQAIYECWTIQIGSEVECSSIACSSSFFSTRRIHNTRPFSAHLFAFVCDSITYACMYVFVYACIKSVHSESAGIKFARLPFMPSGGNTIKRICSLSPRNFAQIFNLSSPFEQLLNVLLCCFV